MSESKGKPSYLLSVLTNKCPRCREGKLFVSSNAYDLKKSRYIKMHEYCPVCGRRTEIEVGFYYGTSYVSYAFSVATSVASFIVWWVTLGFSLYDNRIFYWLAANAVLLLGLQPIFMRLARTIWLAFFVGYDRNWQAPPKAPERVNSDMKNAW